jgi:hypothetical protein
MGDTAGRSVRRAARTCYFLNLGARSLALIGQSVRLPVTRGVWIPIADPSRAPWEMTDLLNAIYPLLDAPNLCFAVLLTDFEVDEFERKLDPPAGPRRAG